MTKVMPSRRCSSINSSCVLSRSFLSSAASGSSSSSTCGRLASERASATRCRWPPESWSGLRFSSPSSFTSASISATRVIDLGARHAVPPQAEGDVVRDGEMRKQRVALEHHVDRPLVRRHRRDVLAVEQDAALVRRLEAGEHAQQRGLAAAGGAEQRKELAGADVERDVIDRAETAEFLRHALDAQQRPIPARCRRDLRGRRRWYGLGCLCGLRRCRRLRRDLLDYGLRRRCR